MLPVRESRSIQSYIRSRVATPETIQQNFPTLTLELVYGAVAFYLGHQDQVEANIREGEEEFARLVPPLSESRPEIYKRLQQARTEPARHS